MLLNLFKGPYSVKDIALGMIETIRAMVISRPRTSSGDRTFEILDKTSSLSRVVKYEYR